MILITSKERKALLANAERAAKDPTYDPKPVVMLYTLFYPCTWLLTQMDPQCPDLAYGLCDVGMGSPEIGSVSLSELAGLKKGFMPLVERDRYFKPRTTLRGYANEARVAGKIIP